MRFSNLVAENAVERRGVPTDFGDEPFERPRGDGDAFAQERFAVRFHRLPVGTAPRRYVDLTAAKRALLGVRQNRRAEEAVAGSTQIAVCQQNRGAPGADRQRRERVFHRPTGQRFVGDQLVDGRFHQRAARFGSDDDTGFDLPEFDRVRDLERAGQEAEASVRQVENYRRLRQAQPTVNVASGRGLLVVAADGRVNEHPDFRTVDAGRLKELFHRVDALIAGKPTAFPKAALLNAGHQLEPSEREFQPLVKRRQAVFEFVGRYNFRREGAFDRLDAHVFVFHRGF